MASDIRDKIRALLAKAQASEHEGESNLFFTKAQELMEEHQVDLFELHTEDPIGITSGVNAQPGPPSYKSDVQVALARYYGCRPILRMTDYKKWTVDLVGPESARMTTELMTDYVWTQVGTQATHLAKDGRYNRQQSIRHIAKALCVRISREVNKRKAQSVREGTSLSLAVVDAVANFIDQNYDNLQTSKSKGPKDIRQSAMDAANKISLNHQVNTGSKSLRLH